MILKSVTIAVIKVCSNIPFSKNSDHIETGQLICKAINELVSIWKEFLLKVISKQTIVQVFPKICLFFKKQSNIDYLKIFFCLTLPFRLNSFKWKAPYWLKCYVNCFTYFNCLLLLINFLILTFNVVYTQLEIV